VTEFAFNEVKPAPNEVEFALNDVEWQRVGGEVGQLYGPCGGVWIFGRVKG